MADRDGVVVRRPKLTSIANAGRGDQTTCGVIYAAHPLIGVGLAGLGLGGHVGEMLGAGVVDALSGARGEGGSLEIPLVVNGLVIPSPCR